MSFRLTLIFVLAGVTAFAGKKPDPSSRSSDAANHGSLKSATMPRKRIWSLIRTAMTFSVATLSFAAELPRYDLSFLELPPGVPDNSGVALYVHSINSLGQVAGVVRVFPDTYSAYIWTNGVPTPLAPLPDTYKVNPIYWLTLNDAGQVAATVTDGDVFPGRPALWTTSQVTLLPNQDQGKLCYATGINNDAEIPVQCGGYIALWQPQTGSLYPVIKSTTDGSCDELAGASLYSINDMHEIAAQMNCGSFMAAKLSVSSLGEALPQPPAPPGFGWASAGRLVNSLGHVAGDSSLHAGETLTPTGDVVAVLWVDGIPTAIDGVAGCADSRHWSGGLNRSDQVLVIGGTSLNSRDCTGIWHSGQTHSLRELIQNVPSAVQNLNILFFPLGANLINNDGLITYSLTTTAGTVRGILLNPVQADTEPPVTTTTLSPDPNASGWHSADVMVQLTASDEPGGSGVKQIEYSLSGAQASGPHVISDVGASVAITTEGLTDLTYFATDNAGNSEQAKVLAVKVDKTAPSVLLSGPVEGASYVLGATPEPACTATDTLSGIANDTSLSQTGGTENGVGSFSATCTGAKDIAGNTADAVTANYSVLYGFPGFGAPIDSGLNRAHAGRVVPIKWQLLRSDGSFVSSLSSVQSISSIPTLCTGEASADVAVAPVEANVLRYDPDANQFRFGWSTSTAWAGSCRTLQLRLDDGTVHEALFTFR